MILTFLALYAAAVLPAANIPFTVDATENVSNEFPGAPRVQSFSFGQWKGRWVFIGGRLAGYHSVGGGMAEFVRADANRDVWVVDTNVMPAKTYHASLDQLPARLAAVRDQWASTGQLHYQDGASLYICGGYGQDHEGKWVTFPVISRVDLPALVDGVMRGKLPAESIQFAKTPLVQSTGGQLIKLSDGYFYLVMGHSFTGNYIAFEGQGENNGAPASQQYLNEIRKLRIGLDANRMLTVSLAAKFQDADEFHRRDLNVAPILSPAGLGLAAYGGVFTPMTQLAYSKPIYLFPGSKPDSPAKPLVDTHFDQKMNAYKCPTLLIYDKSAETMYTTFFGGISRYSWDADTQTFVENPRVGGKVEQTYLDGLQWSDQISTVRKVMAAGRGTTDESVHSRSLPAFLGTDAAFIPAPDLALAEPGTAILDLQRLKGARTFVGYIYGGIRAYPYRFPYLKTSVPYNAGTIPTKASDMILKVFIEVRAQ
jgi:hypothetical protein